MGKDEFFDMRSREMDDLFGMSIEDGNRIEWLLMNAAIPVEKERMIWRGLYHNYIMHEEAQEIIDYLEQNQRDPIQGGFNYQQKDIKWKLKNL